MTATLAIGDKVQINWEGHDLHGREATVTEVRENTVGVLVNGLDHDRWYHRERIVPISVGTTNHDRLPEPTTKHMMTLEETDFPFATVATEGGSEFDVYACSYIQGEPDHRKVSFKVPTATAAFTHNAPKGPTTVGHLIYDHYRLIKTYADSQRSLDSLIKGLQRINELMNEYAETNNLCSEYEETLEEFNNVLSVNGYSGWFVFEGRQEEVAVTIERERTIREQAVIHMSVRKGQEVDWYDIQDEADYADWDTIEDEASVGDVEIVSVDSI